ncbi:putative chromodomain helicase [Talaromyces proteolyticus]|uniref:Chromodomain helicase n=1 Tax=Talaromyces proteolyticus TaxID=1131652 RepID=A0AAD4KPN0_9EURO|nr:putative chromodomain helicase [Talaromyces proteolyticus]KAH8693186.1 putative chromodomain helicase [Talaromyces proteolyticus]
MVYPASVEPSSGTHSLEPLANGYEHTSSSEPASDQEDVAPTDAASETSESFDISVRNGAGAGESTHGAPLTIGHTTYDDSDLESNNQNHHTLSSSPSSSQETKRKSSNVDEVQFMRQNPELYGLRRSGRSRTERRQTLAESDDDDEPRAPISKRRRLINSEQTSKRPSRSVTRSSLSDSNSDEYDASYSRSDRRRHAQSSTRPSTEVRFSSRNATKVANYNEDSDDNVFEDDVADWIYDDTTSAQQSNGPAIDSILDHRLKDGVDPNISEFDVRIGDCIYYIKWQNQSHYHATWETSDKLREFSGFRRLENYFKNKAKTDLYMNNDPAVAPEEKEKWNLDREREIESLEEYRKVDRIIGHREGFDGDEYYVKWRRLNYDTCTWESDVLIKEIALDELDKFLDRNDKVVTCEKREMNPHTRSPHVPITGSPNFLQNGQLKDFQVKGLNFLAYNWARNQNVVLADEMGLGKTVQTIAFINWLRHCRGQDGPFIVVVPLSTIPSWSETFDNWTPDVNYVVYTGSSLARDILKEYELLKDGNPRKPKFNVLLTTYEYANLNFDLLRQIPWQFMAVDEAHRLKNRESNLYTNLLAFRAPARLLITGTPIQNNLAELSALMDFLNPGLVEVEVDMDLSSEAASEKLAKLQNALKPLMLRRTKSKVETDLPPKTEKIIRVELSDTQLEYYKNILTKNYAALNEGANGQKQSLLNIMMELKKASNHPFMFPNAEAKLLENVMRREDVLRIMITSSGKMMLLDQLLAKLKRDGHRVLIFSQMVKMLDVLGDYMGYRGYQYQRLDGTISAAKRRVAMEHFNAPESTDFAFLLSTRAGGLGINLMTADTVILFDSDWNPQADLQAMARAHRIGQTRPVSVYRLVSKDTIEEEVLERARNKLMLEFITIQRGLTEKESLPGKPTRGVGEPTSTDEISRILKRRGQRMFEQTGNQKKLEQLDIDSVLENAEEHKTEQAESLEADGGEEFLKSFEFVDVRVDEMSWDDIIPKEQLAEIKAEEKRKADERYLNDVIEQNRPRKRILPTDGRDEREERKAKRHARVQVNVEAADGSDSEIDDPKRPLVEKELRHLVRAFLRYGDMANREEDIVREARLLSRDRDTVKSALSEITGKAFELVAEDRQKLADLERSGKIPTKKEKKAVLFDLHGVKRINAYTIVERPEEMRILRAATEGLSDYKSFRIPEASKKADYTSSWGAREDGMLCIGIIRHGYGAWPEIRDDHDLGLGDKFFLEEHRVDKKNERAHAEDKATKSPGAVHLVRRADYLISVLRDKTTNANGNHVAAKRAVESHHRNRKVGSTQRRQGSVSASPAPSNGRKIRRESERPRQRSHTHTSRDSLERANTPKPEIVRAKINSIDKIRKHGENGYHDASPRAGSAGNTASHATMEDSIFEPKAHLLLKLRDVKKNFPGKEARAIEMRRLILKIGNFIRQLLRNENYPGLEDRLWNHVAKNCFAAGKTDLQSLKNMYLKVLEQNRDTAAIAR